MNEKLRQQIEQVDWNNPDNVISFYNGNKLYFDNFKLINNIDSLFEFANIKLSYIEALDIKKRYKKADEYLRHVDILVQKLKEHKDFKRLKERYLFDFGMISHRLKKIRGIPIIFQRISENRPR